MISHETLLILLAANNLSNQFNKISVNLLFIIMYICSMCAFGDYLRIIQLFVFNRIGHNTFGLTNFNT